MRISDWSSDVCSSDLIEREPKATTATVSGTPRRQRFKREFAIGRIGAYVAPRVLNAAFDRYRASRTLTMEDVEQTFVDLIRSVAYRNRTVGPTVLCTMFPIDGPALFRFHPAAAHSARVRSEEQTSDILTLMRSSYAVLYLLTSNTRYTIVST